MRRIKNGVTNAVGLSGTWLVSQIVILGILDMKRSSYFSFGPSPLLAMPFTTDMVVDNWWAWTLLVLFSSISSIVMVYNAAKLQPWIESVALNPEIRLPHDKAATFVIVNLSWTIQMATSAITFVYTMTQVDIAIFSAVSAVFMYAICSWQIIYDPARDHLGSTDDILEMTMLPDSSSSPAGDEEENLLLTPAQLKSVIENSDFT